MRETRLAQKWSPNRGSAFLMGLACGAAAGAAVGLLFAWKPGTELREDIAESTGRLRQHAAETFDEAVGALGALVDKGREAFVDNKESVTRAAHSTARIATAKAHGRSAGA
jgi:gas vesicle protein